MNLRFIVLKQDQHPIACTKKTLYFTNYSMNVQFKLQKQQAHSQIYKHFITEKSLSFKTKQSKGINLWQWESSGSSTWRFSQAHFLAQACSRRWRRRKVSSSFLSVRLLHVGDGSRRGHQLLPTFFFIILDLRFVPSRSLNVEITNPHCRELTNRYPRLHYELVMAEYPFLQFLEFES